MDEYQIQLEKSIEQLYQVFEKYPLQQKIEGCPCCISDKEEGKLHSKPLSELTQEDLRPFLFASQTTIGDENDFKHFLPRIFELLVQKGFIGLPDSIIGHLKYLEFKNWLLIEQKAIETFLLSWWNVELAKEYEEYMPFYRVVDCLTSITQLDDDFIKYLAVGLQNSSSNAIPHLLELIMNKTSGTLTHQLWNDQQKEILCDWLNNKEILDLFKKHPCFQSDAWKLPTYYPGMED